MAVVEKITKMLYYMCLIIFKLCLFEAHASSKEGRARFSNTILYPEIERIQVENVEVIIITPNKSNVQNHTVLKVYDEPFQNQKFTFECKSVFPVEWVFECPEITSGVSISMIKQVRLNPTNQNYEYRAHLTLNLNPDKIVNEFIVNAENFPNVTCRIVHFNMSQYTNGNTSIIFMERFGIDDNVTLEIHKNFVFNRTLNCYRAGYHLQGSSKNETCPLTMTVDLFAATYSCESKYFNESGLQTTTANCNGRMDLCKSLVTLASNKSCIKFVRGQNLSRVLHPANTSGIIKCAAPDHTLLYTLYYIVHGKINLVTDVLVLPDVLMIHPTLKSTKYYNEQSVDFQCSAMSSVFSMGSRISYEHANKSDVLLYPPGNESESSGKYVKTVRIQLSKNMTSIICNSSVADSMDWRYRKFNLSVLDSMKPVIISPDKFSNESLIIFRCNATGIPVPEIKFFQSKNVLIEFDRRRIMQKVHQGKTTKVSIGTLVIYNKTSIINSTIICKAVNVVGEDAYSFTTDLNSNAWVFNILLIVIAIAVIMAVGLIIAIVLLYQRWKRRGALRLTEEDCEEFYKGSKSLNLADPLSGALLLAYDISFEVPRSDIIMEETVLGSGQFGIVIQGRYNGSIVAVKTIRHTMDIKYFKALLAELKILQYIGYHPNIVNLAGACTTNIKKMEVLLLLDYCENGNLVKFLRSCRSSYHDLYHHTDEDITKIPLYENNNMRTLTTKDLVRISLQISDAMSFIADKKILHGDLAARNILVTNDKTAKICDFGLAKQLFEYSVYIQKQECPLPLRWMAIESLQDMEFSIQSDVWSCGVTIWEIFTLAELPYPGMNWSFESWRMLKDGYRMEKPQYANLSIYQIMHDCWTLEPKDRPTFKYLTTAFRTELDALRDY